MKLSTAIKLHRAAANAVLAACMMAFAADLSVVFLMLFVGWDWQDPVHTGLPWLVPIGLLTLLCDWLGRLFERLCRDAQALENKAELRASIQRQNEQRGREV